VANNLNELTLAEAAALLRARQISSTELTTACLRRIREQDKVINAFITVTEEAALRSAHAADREILNGRYRGPVHGIPIAVKDNIDTEGVRTTAGSAALLERVPAEDAEVVRLLKDAGAVPLGKLNMWEFAASPTSHWGPVRNPRNTAFEAGYSSSGSGAAVAANFCFAALGTDSGGSVRIPASACGVVGLKPTYGLVSNAGVIAGEGPLDHVGVLCKTAKDAQIMLAAMATRQPQDALHCRVGSEVTALEKRPVGFTVGLPTDDYFQDLDPEVERVTMSALGRLGILPGRSHPVVSLPKLKVPPVLSSAEALAFHAKALADPKFSYTPAQREAIRRQLESAGTSVEYVFALHALRAVRRSVKQAFKSCDVILLPTWKRLPMEIGERQRVGLSASAADRELYNTLIFNVLGVPAVSIPCGRSSSGLPVGLQIVGKPNSDLVVLAYAQAIGQMFGSAPAA
jgi:aspartyl-tRNA(Asn)/glutamyl-tRNA(Gln) amidotransferase subunit A